MRLGILLGGLYFSAVLSAYAAWEQCAVGVAAIDDPAILQEVKVGESQPLGAITTGGKSYQVDQMIGNSTAVVLKTSDETHSIKVYAKKDAAFANFDFYACKFLREKGYEVPEFAGPPEHGVKIEGPLREKLRKKVTFGLDATSVVTRDYVPGFSFDMVNRLRIQLPERDSMANLTAQIELMSSHFKQGEFRAWLIKNGIDPKSMPQSMVDKGDIAHKDFVLTSYGWRLVDP